MKDWVSQYDVKVIVEGSATKLADRFEDTKNPFYEKYQELKKSR